MKNIFYLLLMVGLTSCASQYAPAYSTYSWTSAETKNDLLSKDEADFEYYSMEIREEVDKGNVNGQSIQEDRKILYAGDLRLLVKNADSTIAQIKRYTKEFKGYVSASGSNSTTIYVPAPQLNEALQKLKTMGVVQYYQIESEDVTENYLDVGIRLDNAKKARTRYLELLARAENVEAALKVEKELERLNGEIDSLEGKLKFWDHRMEYSPIQIHYTEKKKLGILGWVGYGMYQTVKWLFIRG